MVCIVVGVEPDRNGNLTSYGGNSLSYNGDHYREKCDLVYQHIYDSYYGQGRSVYSAAA